MNVYDSQHQHQGNSEASTSYSSSFKTVSTISPPSATLQSVNDLLSTLHLPIQLSTLALCTPSLLLTLLESVLLERFPSITPQQRSTFERKERRFIAQFVVEKLELEDGDVLAEALVRGGKRAEDVIMRVLERLWEVWRVNNSNVEDGSTITTPTRPPRRPGSSLSTISLQTITSYRLSSPPPPPPRLSRRKQDDTSSFDGDRMSRSTLGILRWAEQAFGYSASTTTITPRDKEEGDICRCHSRSSVNEMDGESEVCTCGHELLPASETETETPTILPSRPPPSSHFSPISLPPTLATKPRRPPPPSSHLVKTSTPVPLVKPKLKRVTKPPPPPAPLVTKIQHSTFLPLMSETEIERFEAAHLPLPLSSTTLNTSVDKLSNAGGDLKLQEPPGWSWISLNLPPERVPTPLVDQNQIEVEVEVESDGVEEAYEMALREERRRLKNLLEDAKGKGKARRGVLDSPDVEVTERRAAMVDRVEDVVRTRIGRVKL